MKFKKKYLVVSVLVISLFIYLTIFIFGVILKVDSASTGFAHISLKRIGKAVVYSLQESNSFPRDCGSDGKSHPPKQSAQWYSLFDVDKLLSNSGKRVGEDMPKDYFDASIWTVAMNIPHDPPPNLVVLATRNIDPSSLRTRLTIEDMQKYIQFRAKDDDMWILRKYAVVVFADGMSMSIPFVSRTSRRGNRTTYGYIYRNQPFDLTTNLVNGLQVKYLMPDGEVIPTND